MHMLKKGQVTGEEEEENLTPAAPALMVVSPQREVSYQ
jgi:hypothetical protein